MTIIKDKLISLRGQRGMLDRNLAELFEMETKGFNRHVKRHQKIFSEIDVFVLEKDELDSLRYQIGTSNSEKMGLRKLPTFFTKSGIEKLSLIFKKEKIKLIINAILAVIEPPNTSLVFDKFEHKNDNISSKIFEIRGKKVMLDQHLAELYDVDTKRLNQQFLRNQNRFPESFAFQLNGDEWESLRLQIATLKNARGSHRKYLPYVFTEHGTLMLASILNSERAIQVNIQIIEIFVELRNKIIVSEKTPEKRLYDIEKKLSHHDKAIKELLAGQQFLLGEKNIYYRSKPSE